MRGTTSDRAGIGHRGARHTVAAQVTARGSGDSVTAPAIVAAVLAALGWTLPAWVAPAISRARPGARRRTCRLSSRCARRVGARRTRAPSVAPSGGASGRMPCRRRTPSRGVPAGAGVRRWRARLVTWRCGWDRQCAAVVGAGYAARVLALRARIARAGCAVSYGVAWTDAERRDHPQNCYNGVTRWR